MTKKLKDQEEHSQTRFELICDSSPSINWTATPEGYHDWFSRRWYEYTGLSQEESLGLGWKVWCLSRTIFLTRLISCHS